MGLQLARAPLSLRSHQGADQGMTMLTSALRATPPTTQRTSSSLATSGSLWSTPRCSSAFVDTILPSATRACAWNARRCFAGCAPGLESPLEFACYEKVTTGKVSGGHKSPFPQLHDVDQSVPPMHGPVHSNAVSPLSLP